MDKFDKQILFYALVFLILTRVILSLIGAISVEFVKVFTFPWRASTNPFLDVWAKWDSAYYMDIATKGYKHPPINPAYPNVSFFPLYPLILKIFNFFFHNVLITGIIVSNLFLLLSLIIFSKLIKLETRNEKLAKDSLIFLLIFPTSFFFSAVYPESLFLFNILATFYFLKKNNLKLASIFGILTSLTKSIGFLIILPLIYHVMKNKLNFTRILFIFSIPVGTGVFLLYLFLSFNLTPFDLVKIEEKAWLRKPWYNLENVQQFFSGLYKTLFLEELTIKSWKLIYIINLIFTFFVLFLTIFFRNILKDKTYLIFSLTFLFSPIVLGHIIGMTRYVIILFPMYAALASIKNDLLSNIVKFILVAFSIVFFIMFVNWFAII
ncbi:MAG: mannosyltransferase family protein [Candidatus Aenigmatarchaeota archaeon]